MSQPSAKYSIAVFPYLKTSSTVRIAGVEFFSCTDTSQLTDQQKNELIEIQNMLYLRDDTKIQDSTYAICPYNDDVERNERFNHLENIQALVAYAHASPRHEFGDLGLWNEYSSLLVFTSGHVSIYQVYPDYEKEKDEARFELDDRYELAGYQTLVNFQNSLTVINGSRIYTSNTLSVLNLSQDLKFMPQLREKVVGVQLFEDLLNWNPDDLQLQITRAVKWFNKGNAKEINNDEAILYISIAFETLLRLPKEQKTAQFVESITLLLGRTSGLDLWARQFYNARSNIVHEGFTEELRFKTYNNKNEKYQSLISYARRIFQLCLTTILTGAKLARDFNLEDQFITNEQRFNQICRLLSDNDIDAEKRWANVLPIIDLIDRYRYVPESDLQIKTIVGAMKQIAKVILEVKPTNPLKEELQKLSTISISKDHLEELEALNELSRSLKSIDLSEGDFFVSLRTLTDTIWIYLYNYYYWLKKGTELK